MNRRKFLCGLTLGTLSAPLTAQAQQPGKVRGIGFLSIASNENIANPLRALEEALRELGYVEGQHVSFERRFADGKPEHYRSWRGSSCRG